MVHNAIEYGLMAAYAEGFNVLEHAPDYKFDLPEIAELWRRGSVIGSWLLDLTARGARRRPAAEPRSPDASATRAKAAGRAHVAIDAAVPVPVLAAALFARFSSRGEDDFANRLLSAMRAQFGGHQRGRSRNGNGLARRSVDRWTVDRRCDCSQRAATGGPRARAARRLRARARQLPAA